MAPTRASKFKPTGPMLYRSQKRIAAYLTALQRPYKEAAVKLGVTESQLKKYLYGGERTVLKNFNRNAYSNKLFRQTINTFEERVPFSKEDPILVTKKVSRFKGPIAGIEPYDPNSEDEVYGPKYRRYTQSIRQGYELPRLGMEQRWLEYTSSRGLPTSIEEIKGMYADGEINKRTKNSVLTHWRNIYVDMSDDWYEGMEEEFAEYDDYNENAA